MHYYLTGEYLGYDSKDKTKITLLSSMAGMFINGEIYDFLASFPLNHVNAKANDLNITGSILLKLGFKACDGGYSKPGFDYVVKPYVDFTCIEKK
jgi:hypothetical protein